MNPNLQNDNPDELLDRSLNAMRNAPVPDGPSQKVVSDTLAALRNAAEESHSLKIRRITSMKFITRFAASIVLACGLAVSLFMAFRPTVALADVIKKVRESKTISFVATTSIPGIKEDGQTRLFMDNAGHVRIENGEMSVATLDHSAGKILVLQTQMKTASLMTFDPTMSAGAGGMMVDPIAQFKKLAGQASKDLGTKEIDGKQAKGFVVHEDGHDIAVWADAKSGDPVRMEITMPIMGKPAVITFSGFVFDAPLDAAVFSLEVPKGYQLVETKLPNIRKDFEKVIIESLKGFAERANGRFPSRLDDWSEFVKLVKSDTGKLDAASTQWMANVGSMSSFLLSLPADSHAYLGDGVTLNQQNTVVFWYRNAESGKYRAIYADLSVKDADPKTLPKAPVVAPNQNEAPPTPVPTGPKATGAPAPIEMRPVAPPAKAIPAKPARVVY